MSAMSPTTPRFKQNVREALANRNIQAALGNAQAGFVAKRAAARAALPEFDDIRDAARDLKNHVLANLADYLERYEEKVTAAGGHVHWAETAGDAQRIVLDICRKAGAKTVNKGKSMISEECGINDFLEEHGVRAQETDLGEYIIQLRHEAPSHIIAPAIHVTVPEVEAEFRKAHTHLDPGRNLSEKAGLMAEARSVLREKYFAAEVGITGANMLIAETGQSVIVTNEGNGDLSQSLPRVHIVMASLEKIVPTLEDAATVLRVLARSATGQEITVYTTFSSGPRREGDPDGPEEYHVILLDNGRTNMLGTEFQEMLRCIRCGACMNHCPVYQSVGGHAYGWVYPGPMGAVLTPSLIGVEKGGQLPNASTFCGRCEAVCPMRIPLPKMMRHWREREFEKNLTPSAARCGLAAWRIVATRPWAYRLMTAAAARVLRIAAMGKGRLASLPMGRGWTDYRNFPAPQGRTFQSQWRGEQ
ncbi:LutB/LldF family L-lactate oxidation iron-sulfur protein [Limibaculum sp. FT325]|uniref:LutB/LldF family L-lactate oxidation iron-sulfur protein n=1 Tax=Thermohalobaculum sediminis TaxID=2939436 RepID=UPI0020C1880A|nr:LutB/LldF family L-lactate oxidation iron-sulfur protein [Limibaculum sediminis]MCL5779135.1 LutB/LldF family L-lactate oxidation iron-sulfur protein [Limibaculum sediminis]